MTFITTSFAEISSANSTTLALTSTSSFTGSFDEVTEYSEITISINLASSESVTLVMELSVDAIGTNKITKSILIEEQGIHTLLVTSEYFRIIVSADKGTSATGAIQTIYHKAKSKPLTTTANETITDSNDVELTRSIMVGQDAITGEYNNISTNVGGGTSGLTVSLTSPLDAFGRFQVSNPLTLLTSKQQNNNDPSEMDTLTSGTGTTSYTAPFPHTNMQVLANSDRVVRQSRMYSPYQPGKTLSFLITGTLLDDSSVTNVRARIGPFDDLNDKTVDTNPTGDGFFFEVIGGATPTISLVYRTSNDSTISPTLPPTQTDTTVVQSSWNIDKLDGTGVSGFNLDPAERQIFGFQLAWLGTGDVVCGIFNDNKFVPCHRFNFSNGIFGSDGNVAYSTRGSLPCRYELEAIGVPSATATMRQICVSVSSEAGFSPEGLIYSIGDTSTKTVSTTEIPVLSLRLNETATTSKLPRFILNVLKTSLITTSSGDTIYCIYLFRSPSNFGAGPLTGASFINNSSDASLANSSAEYDLSATAVDLTGTTYPFKRIDRGYFSKSASAIDANLNDRIVTLVSDIAGNSDMLVLTCQSFSGNQNIAASIQWQEFE